MNHANDPGRLYSFLKHACLLSLSLALSGPAWTKDRDVIVEAVGKASVGQYKMYQIDIESMGLGLYGGEQYNQGYRNRDGWLGGGTLGNAEAQLYLVDQFASLGLDVQVQGDYANIVGNLRGLTRPNDVYIICAHYDSTSGGERPGGDDNASGTAGVLEAARILSQYDTGATLRFIGFNAEEDWMLGSQDYVTRVLGASHENIVGVLNMDMIVRPGWDSDPQAALDLDLATWDSPICMAWFDIFVNAATTYVPSLIIDAASPDTVYWNASDQGPFLSAGYAALMLSETTAIEVWSGRSHIYYHTAEDASDGLANDPNSPSGVTYDYNFATNVVRATVATVAEQAGLTARPLSDFCEYQDISANPAVDLESFVIDANTYLAVAEAYDGNTADANSTVYQWTEGGFTVYQDLPTEGAQDWEFFSIGEQSYLAVANAGDSNATDVDSTVFRWNGDGFVFQQSLASHRAVDCTFFTIAETPYLAVINAGDGTTDVNSTIYRWNGERFDPFQFLPSPGATASTFFTIDDAAYLAIAKGGDSLTDSIVYRWGGTHFSEFQSLATPRATDCEFFTIGAERYLAIASAEDEGAWALNSTVYHWDGTEFAYLQSLPAFGTTDYEFFSVDGTAYLAAANGHAGDSPEADTRIYQWNGKRFVESCALENAGGTDCEFFAIDSIPYLALAGTDVVAAFEYH